jgi:hypothetical protein
VKIRGTVVLSQNITTVYDQLDLRKVDTTQLKSLIDVDPGPTVWDTPDFIMVVYPTLAATVRLAEKRVSVTLSQQGSRVGQEPMWDIVEKSHELVTGLGSELRAYGFNIDIGFVMAEGDPHSVTRECFLRDVGAIEAVVGGKLVSFAPKFVFTRDAALHSLRLEPVDSERLQVSLNVHVECAGVQLPDKARLDQAYRDEYKRLVRDVPALLTEES